MPFFKRLIWLACWLMPASVFATDTATRPASDNPRAATIQLLQDPSFARGFQVFDPKLGKHVVRGKLQPQPAIGEPVWGLAQWSSRWSLADAQPERLATGAVRFADPAKSVTFCPTTGSNAGLVFTLSAGREYDGRFRKSTDPWAHLLAEQRFQVHPRIVDLERLRFRIRCRLLAAKDYAPAGANLPGQAAQFLAYLTVQNLNRESPGYGDYLWFGVPIYDSRYRTPVRHAAADIGTGKFIYNPPGTAYTSESLHDGQWVSIDRDVLPLILEGLRTAWDQGHLKHSRELADFRLGGFNIGWELPGTLDVSMQFDGLGIEATLKNGVKP
ncbi:MAG TPA: hypothetical protein PLQ89_01140 [Phycisphaerae bacterium]|nr:hypothetical protein [Phycisphaerae bacterium]